MRSNHLAYAATQGKKVVLFVVVSCIIIWWFPIWSTYALLAWGRSVFTNAAKIECAHRIARKLLTEYNQTILTCHSINDYFALLKAFITNTINFHQYFKDKKLSFHQPSHMYNTRHRTNSNFNTPLLNHSTGDVNCANTQKCYLYQVIPIWDSLTRSLKNFTSNFTFKNRIKSFN